MRKVTVLLGVVPPALCRVLDYLLRDRFEFRVVGHCGEKNALRRQAVRLLPDVLVINDRLLGKEPGDMIAHLKRFTPRSKLIVIASPETTGQWRRLGADACLSEEALVRRLAVRLRQLAASTCLKRSEGAASARAAWGELGSRAGSRVEYRPDAGPPGSHHACAQGDKQGERPLGPGSGLVDGGWGDQVFPLRALAGGRFPVVRPFFLGDPARTKLIRAATMRGR